MELLPLGEITVIQSDVVGVVLVYIYVAILLIVTEFLSKRYPLAGRKTLHIMVGNIAFILPIFQTKETMAFIAAGPFILLTFLMSPYSPIKSIKGKTSEAGHGMGLVYYSIAWTILAYFFFDHKEIIAIGIFAMSYGDGLASLIGIKLGKKKYQIFQDTKSYIGSFTMFIVTFIMMIVALIYYNISFVPVTLFLLMCITAIAAIVEGITPLGLDNLSVPFVTTALYWLVIFM